jgi:flagellar biosynthesis protein FlhB
MKEDEKIERLGNKFLSDLPLENPSLNFSDKVMQQILKTQVDNSYFKYKPLINFWGWAAIFCIIGTVFTYSLINPNTGVTLPEFSWFTSKINGFSTFFSIKKMPQLSEALISVILIFSFMALLEISVIKRLFDRRATQ